jgi:hypothetical protein
MKHVGKRILNLLLTATLVVAGWSQPAQAEGADDPDTAVMNAAKQAVDNYDFPAVNQAEYQDQTALVNYASQKVKQVVNNGNIQIGMMLKNYDPPEEGTAARPEGCKGRYQFVAYLIKGDLQVTSNEKTVIITGTISGKGKGMLDPSGKVTRAEIAVVLMRFLIGQD